MKCICGYERLKDYQNDGVEVGDKDFIEVNGSFTVKEEDYRGESIREVDLCACPKCQTIRLVYSYDW